MTYNCPYPYWDIANNTHLQVTCLELNRSLHDESMCMWFKIWSWLAWQFWSKNLIKKFRIVISETEAGSDASVLSSLIIQAYRLIQLVSIIHHFPPQVLPFSRDILYLLVDKIVSLIYLKLKTCIPAGREVFNLWEWRGWSLDQTVTQSIWVFT